MALSRHVSLLASCVLASCFAGTVSAAPKVDKETCQQLKTEQQKFIETGILADIERGAVYAKDRLSAERIREIELYITLDEQLKFGCREATLTGDAIRAGEAARRLELNPDADPTAPPPKEPTPAPANAGDAAAADAPAQPAAKPQASDRPAAAQRPKADDAYQPPEGNGSTLDDQADEQPDGRADVP